MSLRRQPLHLKGPSVALAVLASAGIRALAADVDTSNWECSLCPFAEGYRADYSAGVSSVSDDAARFGDANGYNEQGAYLNLDGDGTHTSDGYRLRWAVEDLGLDSRVVQFEGGRPGSYGYQLEYRQLPHYVFDTTNTVFKPSSGNTLTLPADWTRSGLTSGFTALDSSLVRRDIQSERKAIEVGGHYIANTRLSFFADYQREERDGVSMISGSYFTNASLLPRPFDYQTDQFELGARYRMARGTLQLAYYGSVFDNNANALTWDNPFLSFAGAERGRLAEPPENSFHQFTLSGTFRAPYDSVIGFSAGFGEMEQDETLLAYTINPNLAASALPRTSFGGQVDTTNLSLTVTARPVSRARLKFAYRFDERDNGSSIDSWNRIIVDSFVSGDIEANTPYSFERSRLSVSAQVDLRDSLVLSAGYDRKDLDRDLQEVAEQTEDTGWGRLRWRPNAFFDINAKGGTAKRTIDSYDEDAAVAVSQNPLLRKYNLAYRFREFAELMISASLPDQAVTLSASLMFADDDYAKSLLGITAANDMRFATDLSWAVSDKTSVYLHGGLEDIDADQAGSEAFADPDWSAAHNDEFSTVGAGFRLEDLGNSLDLEVDYTQTDGTTAIVINANSGGASTFPELRSELRSLRVRATYRWSERTEVVLQLRYENFETQDWALAGVGPATLPTILTLGASPYDYDVLLIGVGFNYRFGDRELSLVTD